MVKAVWILLNENKPAPLQYETGVNPEACFFCKKGDIK